LRIELRSAIHFSGSSRDGILERTRFNYIKSPQP
jgi:hypothetical protein